MRKLPKKELEKEIIKAGKRQGVPEENYLEEAEFLEGIHVHDTGEILVLKGSPSSVVQHEVGHKVLGHTSEYNIEGRSTIGDDIYDEILAEKYSYDMRGKPYTYRLAIPAINMLVQHSYYGFSPESAVFWTLKILKDKLGITATKSQRRELARHARGYLRRPK